MTFDEAIEFDNKQRRYNNILIVAAVISVVLGLVDIDMIFVGLFFGLIAAIHALCMVVWWVRKDIEG